MFTLPLKSIGISPGVNVVEPGTLLPVIPERNIFFSKWVLRTRNLNFLNSYWAVDGTVIGVAPRYCDLDCTTCLNSWSSTNPYVMYMLFPTSIGLALVVTR